ncbi:unnamed protein product, partial [Laminaria digitata]
SPTPAAPATPVVEIQEGLPAKTPPLGTRQDETLEAACPAESGLGARSSATGMEVADGSGSGVGVGGGGEVDDAAAVMAAVTAAVTIASPSKASSRGGFPAVYDGVVGGGGYRSGGDGFVDGNGDDGRGGGGDGEGTGGGRKRPL